mmetsp:Transcript_44725/g.133617  ORF Transcript_44725/g.133617 Transcript_44725/m.133617 type:complete len:201 (-) Transcript_44725:242-844(-)
MRVSASDSPWQEGRLPVQRSASPPGRMHQVPCSWVRAGLSRRRAVAAGTRQVTPGRRAWRTPQVAADPARRHPTTERLPRPGCPPAAGPPASPGSAWPRERPWPPGRRGPTALQVAGVLHPCLPRPGQGWLPAGPTTGAVRRALCAQQGGRRCQPDRSGMPCPDSLAASALPRSGPAGRAGWPTGPPVPTRRGGRHSRLA